MNTPAPNRRRIEQLFQDLEDGCISGPDHAELMDLLRQNRPVRSAYIAHMRFSGLLYTKAEAIAELQGVPPLAVELPPGRQILRSTLAAAAVIALAAFVASFYFPASPPPASVKSGPDTVWKYSRGGLGENKRFLPGTALAVDRGTLEIQLSSGSQLILEGPADVTLKSPDEIRMTSGRVWVRAGSDHFTVVTPTLRILDLGTEFGVNTSEQIDTEVHVAKGRVRVTPLRNTLQRMEITASQAVRADAVGRLRSIGFDATRFQTRLPSKPPYLHWSFDHHDAAGFQAEGHALEPSPMTIGSLDDRDATQTPTSTSGKFGEAMSILNPDQFAQTDFPGIEGNLPRTVAFWIKALPIETTESIPLVCWGLPSEFGTKWVTTLNPDGRKISSIWGGAWGNSYTPPGQSILDGSWHHLAYVFTGHHDADNHPEIIHYLDGTKLQTRNPIVAMPVNTDCGAKNSWPLTIGVQLWSTPSRPTFTGAIDELYVIRGVLDASQIRDLIEHNQLRDGKTPTPPGTD